MSYSSRPLPSHLRQASTSNSTSNGQSPILLARINEKKAELENLKQLKDLSAALAGQMQMLEDKLATLSDGTEGMRSIYSFGFGQPLISLAVATVLSNWHNVLRAISMASSSSLPLNSQNMTDYAAVKIPKPKDTEDGATDSHRAAESEQPLPQTLVRIPREHAPMLQQSSSGGGGSGE